MSISIGNGTFGEEDVLGVVLAVEVSVSSGGGVVSQTYPYMLVGVVTESGGFRWAEETRGPKDGVAAAEAAVRELDARLRGIGLVGMLRRDNEALTDRKAPAGVLAAVGEFLTGRHDDVIVLRGIWGRPGTASSVVGDEHFFEVSFPEHGSLPRHGGGDGKVLSGTWAEVLSLVP